MVTVDFSRKIFSSLASDIKHFAELVLKILRRENFSLEIYLLSDKEMASLNFQTRRRSGPASVLSFKPLKNFPHPDKKQPSLGEIYLAPAYLKRRGYDVKLLIIHGVLHLLGFDHQTGRDAQVMDCQERQILKSLGLFLS